MKMREICLKQKEEEDCKIWNGKQLENREILNYPKFLIIAYRILDNSSAFFKQLLKDSLSITLSSWSPSNTATNSKTEALAVVK